MSKPAAMPLFGDAYLADTTHLTTEEHGAYLLLMIAAWRQEDCGLPMDDKKLARIAGLSTKKWTSIRGTVLEFWKLDNGRIYQPRLTKEHQYVCQKSQANRKSAEARWNKQPIENKQTDECERISEGNTPPPPPLSSLRSDKNDDEGAKARIGTRLSDDWQPLSLPQNLESCVDGWPPGAYEREVQDFKDYWTALPGTKARKLDWDKTWHNRIRQRESFYAKGKKYGTGNSNNGPNGEPFSHNPMVQAIAARRAERASGEPQFSERDAGSWP